MKIELVKITEIDNSSYYFITKDGTIVPNTTTFNPIEAEMLFTKVLQGESRTKQVIKSVDI